MSVETTRESRASGMALQTSGRESEKIHTTLTKTVFSKIVQQHSSQVSSSFQACTCLKFFTTFFSTFRSVESYWMIYGSVKAAYTVASSIVAFLVVVEGYGTVFTIQDISRPSLSTLAFFRFYCGLCKSSKKFLFSDLDGIFRQKKQ